MPEKPKPSIVSVYGNDAPARAAPNSACTAGSATTTDHMPTPPIVDRSSAVTRRTHAYGDSTPPATWRRFACAWGARSGRVLPTVAMVPDSMSGGDCAMAFAASGEKRAIRMEARERHAGDGETVVMQTQPFSPSARIA